jgi:chromosome segregation ATPase
MTGRGRFFLAFSGCLAAAVAAGWCAGASKPAESRMGELQRKLQETRDGVELAVKDADKENKAFYRFEHDICYTNSAILPLYREIRELETRLAEQRKKLSEKMMTLPEMKRIQKRREAAFKKVSALKDQELSILKAIEAEKWKEQAEREKAQAGGKSQ